MYSHSSVEAFIDEGRVAWAESFFPEESNQTLELYSCGGTMRLISMEIYVIEVSMKTQQKSAKCIVA